VGGNLGGGAGCTALAFRTGAGIPLMAAAGGAGALCFAAVCMRVCMCVYVRVWLHCTSLPRRRGYTIDGSCWGGRCVCFTAVCMRVCMCVCGCTALAFCTGVGIPLMAAAGGAGACVFCSCVYACVRVWLCCVSLLHRHGYTIDGSCWGEGVLFCVALQLYVFVCMCVCVSVLCWRFVQARYTLMAAAGGKVCCACCIAAVCVCVSVLCWRSVQARYTLMAAAGGKVCCFVLHCSCMCVCVCPVLAFRTGQVYTDGSCWGEGVLFCVALQLYVCVHVRVCVWLWLYCVGFPYRHGYTLMAACFAHVYAAMQRGHLLLHVTEWLLCRWL